MNIPKLSGVDVEGKTVMVRGDLDVDIEQRAKDIQQKTDGEQHRENLRLVSLIPTVKYLQERNSKIILIGHRGRPEGKVVKELSMEPVSRFFEGMLREELGEEKLKNLDMHMMENLRFDPGEEANDDECAKHLCEEADVYVNEAFSVSHRKHASVNALPLQFIKQGKPVCLGLRFEKEIENLSRIFDNPKRPVVVLISGVKEDKLDYIEPFSKFADKILVSGRLPEYLGDEKVSVRLAKPEDKVVSADLVQDKEDITIHSMEVFEEIIKGAGTVVVSGPVGKFEDEGHRQGTQRVFEAVVNSGAFKVAGGGDTEAAIRLLGLSEKFDWISVGGGAMLDFLATKTLPGIEALKE